MTMLKSEDVVHLGWQDLGKRKWGHWFSYREYTLTIQEDGNCVIDTAGEYMVNQVLFKGVLCLEELQAKMKELKIVDPSSPSPLHPFDGAVM